MVIKVDGVAQLGEVYMEWVNGTENFVHAICAPFDLPVAGSVDPIRIQIYP